MKKSIFLLIFALCSIGPSICDSNEYFTVVANRLLRLNKPYRVAVQHQGYGSEKTLQIGIKNSKYQEFKNITLNGDGDEIIEFLLTNHFPGDYSLEVKGDDNFHTTRQIEIVKKKFSIFIQTDKSIYKPADKVQFRVLLLDADTRPYTPSNVDIFITDGDNNRIKQFDKPKFHKGVFQSELKLSELPVMGIWNVNVKVDGQKEEKKSFEVAEYVLPKFEFKIDANPDANYKDGKIRATVSAKYTFGKKVKGNATVMVKSISNWYRSGARTVKKSVDVDGKKVVEFDIEEELGIKNKHAEHTVELFGSFMEELSGKEQNATAKVQIHITPHKISFKTSGEKFKPGLPFNVTAILKLHDKNTPVTDSQTPVKFKITNVKIVKSKCPRYSWGSNPETQYDCDIEESSVEEKEIFPKNGKADLDFDVPMDIVKFRVEAKYFDTVATTENILKAESESNQFLQIKLLTIKPKVNEPIQIEVRGTEKLKKISYQIIGSGSIIESKTLPGYNEKQFKFNFKATDLMAPKVYVVVYYIASNGEIISDKLELELEADLKNKMDIQLSKNQLKPGEDVEIAVNSQSNSFIGLLGVDQSVLVLKKGNDIEKSQVTQEQKMYDKAYGNYDNTKSYKDFKDSDAIVITNAKTEYKKPFLRPDYHYPEYALSFERERPRFTNMMRGGFSGFGVSGLAMSSASAQSFGGTPYSMSRTSQPQDSIMDSEFTSMRSDMKKNRVQQKQIEPKPLEIRKEFPETWLFESFELSPNETFKKITKKAPDTITSWIITGFSMNPTYGLGLTKEASTLNIFQPFFVSTNLPYSIKRGEVVAIPISVFNYMQNDQEVEVKFFNSNQEFEFVEVNEEENETKRRRRKRGVELERKKRVFVPSNEGAIVKFMIRSLKVGYLTIKVTAESQVAGDGVEQKLLVVPEGVTQFKNEAILLDLREKSEFKTSIDISIPNDAVENSTRIEAAVSGDLLGPSIENLDKLIKLPYGCGEQNMVNFVPNIVVLDYLTSVDKLTSEIKAKAISHLESGYQRELGYKHEDGSYSAFGKRDNSGSTWLTAFVLKSFNEAAKYIKIETSVMEQGLAFLEKVQKSDGSFPEVGRILASNMQGGASKGIGLTAYVLTTFLECENPEKYQRVIDKGLRYILDNIDALDDKYSLAIASYAFQLAKHPFYEQSKKNFIEKLDSKSENSGKMKFWTRDASITSNRPDSISIEMTSYGLLAFIEGGRIADAFGIGKWLITQRNENGGFQSTQDTVVGLQALAKLASKVSTNDNNLKINIDTENKNLEINVAAENSLMLQKYEIPPSSRHFDISASGHGVSLLQVAYRYNIDDSLKLPRFTLAPTIDETSNKEFLHLIVCTKFVPDSFAVTSNMAVMEVTLPSGFTFDSDHMKELKAVKRVKKVETEDSDTKVIVYFDDIDANEICPNFKAYRTHSVAKQKQSPIIIYDYYDNSRQARVFYNPPEISLCDICGDEDECRSACESDGISVIS